MAKKVAVYGLLGALALVLSFVDRLIPVSNIPGVRLGLANVVVLFALYRLSPKGAFGIMLVKAVMGGLMAGAVTGILYSLGGSLLSFLAMWPAKRLKGVSIVGVSVVGAVSHNLGQIAVAVLILGWAAAYYLPFLLVAGAVSGALTGSAAHLALKALKMPR